MKGIKSVINEKLEQYNWDWIIVGGQLLTFGFNIWYNARHDPHLHPLFFEASEPFWVYIPFLIGTMSLIVGFGKLLTPLFVKITLNSLTIYWTVMTYLMFINDGFRGHNSIIAGLTIWFIPRLWYMAYKTDFYKGGVKI